MGDWGSVEVARQDFDRWDRERRERRGTWRDSVAWARGIESRAPSAHPDDDGAEARSGADGAAQDDTETREVRVDVDPMLAGASGEDGEMKTIVLFGASDDLVEIEGAFREEFGGYGGKKHVVMSTGDRFTIEYGRDGIWHVDHEDVAACTCTIERATDPDSDSYSDVATIEGPIEWVDCWDSWPPHRSDVLERLVENGVLERLSSEALTDLYRQARNHGRTE